MSSKAETYQKYLIARTLQVQGKGYGEIAKIMGYPHKSGVQYLLTKFTPERKQTASISSYRATIILDTPEGARITQTLPVPHDEIESHFKTISEQVASEIQEVLDRRVSDE